MIFDWQRRKCRVSLLDKVKTVLGLNAGESLHLRPLKNKDLPSVLKIEEKVYDFPWSEQIFKDCLAMNYSSWSFQDNGQLIGYAIISIAVGEAHILNICVDPDKQNAGFGRLFLAELFNVAKYQEAERIFLEVRPSNKAAVTLYEKIGFKQIGRRKGYYPVKDGREDALVYSYDLTAPIE